MTPTAVPSASPDTILGLSGTDVAALGTIALAIVAALAFGASVYLAVTTRRMAIATRQAAEATLRAATATETAAKATQDAAVATREEAEATQEEAKATLEQATATKESAKAATETLAELRRTRELDWRPHLVWKYLGGSSSADQVQRQMHIQNLGRGPAINAIYLREEEISGKRHFMATERLDLAAGAADTFTAATLSKEPHPELFTRESLPRELMICMDQFYTWYRFWPRTIQPGTYTVDFDEEGIAQDWDAPGWVKGAEELVFGS